MATAINRHAVLPGRSRMGVGGLPKLLRQSSVGVLKAGRGRQVSDPPAFKPRQVGIRHWTGTSGTITFSTSGAAAHFISYITNSEQPTKTVFDRHGYC